MVLEVDKPNRTKRVVKLIGQCLDSFAAFVQAILVLKTDSTEINNWDLTCHLHFVH